MKITITCSVVLSFLMIGILHSQSPESFKPTQKEIEQIQNEANDFFIQNQIKKNVQNNRNIESIIRLIADDELKDSKFVSSLGLTDGQLEVIQNIFTEFSTKLDAVESSKPEPQKYGSFENQIVAVKNELKQNLLEDVNDVLLPHQMAYVAQMDVTKSGLPKLLTKSPIGELLELTDGQKRRIEAKSDELAKKIEKFIHESRQEAFDIVFDELEDSQKSKLLKLYDQAKLKRQISTTPLHLLYGQYAFELPEDFDNRMSPSIRVIATEIKEEKDK